MEQNIKYWVAEIDKKLSAQLNEVMHDPAFQKLEGSWRGLYYLVHKPEGEEGLRIKGDPNVNKKDLQKDLERALEFDQSTLFKKVYEEEFGHSAALRTGPSSATTTSPPSLDDVTAGAALRRGGHRPRPVGGGQLPSSSTWVASPS